jgi:hypothetical protein
MNNKIKKKKMVCVAGCINYTVHPGNEKQECYGMLILPQEMGSRSKVAASYGEPYKLPQVQ